MYKAENSTHATYYRALLTPASLRYENIHR